MGKVNQKDQKQQPYLVESKRCMKGYLNMVRRLINTPVHNALIIPSMNRDIKTLSHVTFRLELIKELLETHGKTVQSARVRKPSKTPAPSRLNERHFFEKIPPTEKKVKPSERCAVCCKKTKKRKETSFLCNNCAVGLCFNECFKIYHAEGNFQVSYMICLYILHDLYMHDLYFFLEKKEVFLFSPEISSIYVQQYLKYHQFNKALQKVGSVSL